MTSCFMVTPETVTLKWYRCDGRTYRGQSPHLSSYYTNLVGYWCVCWFIVMSCTLVRSRFALQHTFVFHRSLAVSVSFSWQLLGSWGPACVIYPVGYVDGGFEEFQRQTGVVEQCVS